MVGLRRLRREGERVPHPRRPAQLRHPLQVGPAHHRQPRPRRPSQVRLVVRPRHGRRAAGRRRRLRPASPGRRAARGRGGPRRRPAPGGRRPPDAAAGAAPRPSARPSSPPPTTARRPSPPVSPCTPPPRCWRRSRSWPRTSCPRLLPRPSPPRTAGSPRPTWPMSAARPWRAGRSRSPPPGGTTCSSSARPGSGKTMLARRLRGVLPPLLPDEAVETAAIHSAAGLPAEEAVARRPFRSPHHTASDVALVGGGGRPRPGEVSLAHNGVLFLDELPEFRRATLEVLRQPLEEGHVTVARHRGAFRMPARFQLVAAMNPCPCGRRGSLAGACSCTPGEIRSYLGRLSGPLLDRIDLHVPVPAAGLRRGRGPAGRGDRRGPGPGGGRPGAAGPPLRGAGPPGQQRGPGAGRAPAGGLAGIGRPAPPPACRRPPGPFGPGPRPAPAGGANNRGSQ